jgi:catechol 2,3-dioxygenase-like lactoylglutathione lyase family enzyme
MRLVALDHVVRYSTNIDRTVEFYAKGLGLRATVFDSTFHALHFGALKINIRDASASFTHSEEPPLRGRAADGQFGDDSSFFGDPVRSASCPEGKYRSPLLGSRRRHILRAACRSIRIRPRIRCRLFYFRIYMRASS